MSLRYTTQFILQCLPCMCISALRGHFLSGFYNHSQQNMLRINEKQCLHLLSNVPHRDVSEEYHRWSNVLNSSWKRFLIQHTNCMSAHHTVSHLRHQDSLWQSHTQDSASSDTFHQRTRKSYLCIPHLNTHIDMHSCMLFMYNYADCIFISEYII